MANRLRPTTFGIQDCLPKPTTDGSSQLCPSPEEWKKGYASSRVYFSPPNLISSLMWHMGMISEEINSNLTKCPICIMYALMSAFWVDIVAFEILRHVSRNMPMLIFIRWLSDWPITVFCHSSICIGEYIFNRVTIWSTISWLTYNASSRLTHSGLVTPFGVRDHGYYWFKSCQLLKNKLKWILIKLQQVSIKIINLKMSSAIWQPFCSVISVLTHDVLQYLAGSRGHCG